MPTTKRGNFYFGLMMCIGMVIVMTSYNLFTNGLIGKISLKGMALQYILGFMIAFSLEAFVVGPLARKAAFSLPYDKSNKVLGILSMTFFMVTGMVLLMSLYGLGNAYFAESLPRASLLGSYASIVLKNYMFAFPLQLVIMGPLVRFLFTKFIQRKMQPNPSPS